MSSLPPTVDTTTAPLRFGSCELRLPTRELLVSGRPEPVRRRVFDLMVFLVEQRHRVVTHRELLRQVWGSAQVSTKMLARAVMEARRAVGDPADDPKLFASVHGVGYRFIGVLTDTATAAPGAEGPGVDDRGTVHDLLNRARRALDADLLDEAQLLADEALAEADRGPSHTDRVHALVLCSSVALRRSTAVEAARLAAQALRLAQAEGQPALVAQARLAVGYVHVVAGDRALAIRHFEECREPLSAPGFEADLQVCLNRLAMALRDTGKPDVGLQFSRRALALAQRIGRQRSIFIERNNEVMFLLYIGDREAGEGQTAAAHKTFEEALDHVDRLLQDLPSSMGARLRQSAMGNRAFLLQRLGRLDEAWRMLAELEADLVASKWMDSPVYSERQRVTHELRATLLAEEGRYDEALHLVAQSLEAVLRLDRRGALPRLYGLASDIAERAGQLGPALKWARLQGEARLAVRADETAALSLILEAEVNAEDMQADLQRTRSQVAVLMQENAELRQRAELLQGAVPVAPDTGLANCDQLAALISARHRHARAKGLPLCIGLLVPFRPPATDDLAALGQRVAPAVLQRVAALLAGHADIAYPAVDVGGGRVAFRVRDAGPSRAAEVCRAVLELLQQQDWESIGHDPGLSWRGHIDDAARFDSIEVCVNSLALRTTP